MTNFTLTLRKEVIQPHLPIRLPCYDFTPVIGSTFGSSSPFHCVRAVPYFFTDVAEQVLQPSRFAPTERVRSLTSGISNSHGVTGGVYKTRERIHRDILIRDY